MLKRKKYFDLIGYGFMEAGTIYDNAALGIKAMIGKLPHNTNIVLQWDCFHFDIYCRGEAKFVARDATLEGGLFNSSNTYVIPPGELEHFVLRFDAGFEASYKKIKLEFSESAITPEFKNGWPHACGHLGIEYHF